MGIIKSNRTFGIEIEMGNSDYGNLETLRDSIPSSWQFHDDGSIRNAVQNPVELVSPILRGESGERKVIEVCEKLNTLGFDTTDTSCGFHVHLGADEFKESHRYVKLSHDELIDHMGAEADSVQPISVVSDEETLRKFLSIKEGAEIGPAHAELLIKRIEGNVYPLDTVMSGYYYTHIRKIGSLYELRRIDEVAFIQIMCKFNPKLLEIQRKIDELTNYLWNKDGEETLSDHQRIEEVIDERGLTEQQMYAEVVDKSVDLHEKIYLTKIYDERNVDNLVSLLAFYVYFDDVISAMLPESRRVGNMYCRPVSDTFTLSSVLKCKTQDDFEKLWYLEKDKNTVAQCKGHHYNNSRYHNVNFHSLFNRHGTIEIRSHGSTADSKKILLWTALHQLIVDSVADRIVTRDIISKVSKKPVGIKEKVELMLDIIIAPDYIRKYVHRMVEHFSGI